MTSRNQGPQNLTKQMLLTFIITAAALYVIGRLAMALAAPWIAPVRPGDLAQFINSSMAIPKPLQRLVFLCVVLSVLPVLALAAHFARKLHTRMFRSSARFNAEKSLAAEFSHSSAGGRPGNWPVMALVMGFAVYAGGYFRWFGAGEVDYKFIDPVSFDAVIYSIMHISQGGTCLIDVVPQYGCYGEFFRPLWIIVNPSVIAVTTVLFFLYLAAVFAAMRFASRVIQEPTVLLICGISLVCISSFYGFFDPNFQYWPLRTIFPCLALALAPWWQNGGNSYKAFAMGVFGALAISWNLDSGVPVFLSLSVLIALSGCTQASSLRELFTRKRFFHLGIYGFSVLATIFMLLGYLSFKGGAVADPGLFVHFQRIYYMAGYGMLPMPDLPHPWGVVALVILLALSALAVRTFRGQSDGRSELLGFAAILAIGIFVYYTGRSHIRVLESVSWLPAILAFCLTDRLVADNSGKWLANVLHKSCAGFIILLVASWTWFYGRGINERWEERLSITSHSAPLVEDAKFIDRQTKPYDKVAILAPSQGSLVLTAGRAMDWSGPGMIETAIWPDAINSMEHLRDHGPENLFIDPRVRGRDNYQTVFSAFEIGIRKAYVTRNWAPNGRLLQLVRRKMVTDQDAVPYDRPTQVSGQRSDFPLLVAKNLRGRKFELEMKIVAASLQEHLAILVSTASMNDEPFMGLLIYHQFTMGADRWALAMGYGSSWKETPLFEIPAGRPVILKISYAAPELEIDVDDKAVFESRDFKTWLPTEDPLYVGDGIAHMYQAGAPMDGILDSKFRSPNYFKIQDRRFRGEVISARLLP